MFNLFFYLLAILGSGPAICAEDSNKNTPDSKIDFNDPAFIERVNENMHFSSPDEFKDMSSEDQERAQNVMYGGND